MRVADLRPGWRTDFILHRHGGAEIAERDDCLVVRTPANPTYYWGNCLVLAAPPDDAALPHWLERFAAEVAAGRPEVEHVAIGINPPHDGRELPAWRAAGFEIAVNAVMQLRPGGLLAMPKMPQGAITVRPIDFATEVPAIIELECADVHGFDAAGYRAYRERQFARMRTLHEAGLLEWFGLWCDGTLAADCGLMRERAEPGATARFQRVATHPQWRRRGLCTALIDAVSRHGLERWRAGELVMVADPAAPAIGIYRSLGFRVLEHECAMQRKAPRDSAAGA